MRQISVKDITQCLRDLFMQVCVHPDPGLAAVISRAKEKERSPFGRQVLTQLLENIDIADSCGLPLCQDTGMAVVFMEIGQEVHFNGGDFNEAVQEGVRSAYQQGYLRKSVLTPLERVNTGDNTPAVLHVSIVPGDRVEIWVTPKGFGSENMSRVCMLTPSAGRQGVIDSVVEVISQAGSNPCPPMVVGVGIGSTFEGSALLAKKALLRDIGSPPPQPELASLEDEILLKANCLGIGPMGLGGDTTVLAVHALSAPTHIASLPVAVNIQCHCLRHGHAVL